MKVPLLSIALAFALPAYGAPGPLRVLYLGQEGTPAGKHCAKLMQELGRDAVWFDYTSDPNQTTPAWVESFDVVLLDAPRDLYPALAGIHSPQVVSVDFPADETAWSGADFLKPVQDKLAGASGPARRREWETFLTQREPEKREKNPHVANYEKRPEPVTFQEPMSVKASMQRTQVPVDMHLELFAAEPEIAKPIAFAWDERGRLWVAETRDYPHGVTPSGEGNDSIKICEDTDGDGRADKFTVFADKLNLPTSLVFARGGIIVAQAPRLLFLQDTNGDDRADVREVLMESWGVRDTHAQTSNLHYGYDNWIYGCVGYSGFKGVVGGKMKEFLMGTFRFRADGQELEFLHQFSNNSWGQSANRAGDQFGGTANNAPLFYGGIPQYVVPVGMKAMTAKKINVEDKAHAITPNYRQVDVFGGYTAAAGSAFIESAKLPARLQGKAMVCEPTMKLIALLDVRPDGAGYVARDGFNLVASSDEWMSPVFAEVGPDGAVWFADWQNFIIQHNPTPSVGRGGYDAVTGPGGAHENALRDHARGRIYRVVWNQAKDSAQHPTLKEAHTPELVKALGSDTQYWRLTAQRLLVDGKKSDSVPALHQKLVANDGDIAAVHALWTLQGLGRLEDSDLKAALVAKDPALRRNAIRALRADARGVELMFGAGVIGDPDAPTRLAALVKIAEFPTTEELKTVVARLANEPAVQADEWLREAARVMVRKHKAISYQEGPNLLPNPGFEVVGPDGLPAGWKRRDYGQAEATAKAVWTVLENQAHAGQRSVRCITRGDADTSLFADVPLKPNTRYRLSGWIKTHALKGRASLNSHGAGVETERISDRESDWSEVETFFDSRDRTKASINILHVARGDSLFDDVKLCEVIGDTGDEKTLLAGDVKRGEQIFLKHQAVACVLCHMLKGQGSTVGPALDGLATRAKPEYIKESLLEPNKVLAKGYENLGASPMPPLGLILKPQELEDVQAFLQTLK